MTIISFSFRQYSVYKLCTGTPNNDKLDTTMMENKKT